jgi:uncharacterized membrane protein
VNTPRFSLTLKRNCSMSPKALAAVFVALAVLVLAIGAGFALVGAWLILPFAGLEVLLLGAAFVLYARHAADYERIELERGRLTVEVADAERIEHHEFDAGRARVCLEKERVVLRGAKQELELGRHLDAEGRAELAAELEKRLIRGQGT